MKVYRGHDMSFGKAYEKLLTDLKNNPQFESAPRGQRINEIIGASLEFCPSKSFYYNARRSSQIKYIAAELVWYFNKSNDVNFINKYSKFWNNIVNPDGKTVNSAYGYLIFNKLHRYHNVTYQSQWQWAYQQLVNDKDTRQAIMHYNMTEHQFKVNKDFVCTMYQVFHIRDNKLYSTVHMRSNDVILGLPTDVAWFSILQINMLSLLKQNKYPDLELGTMTHVSNSMHYYERHHELISEMLNSEFMYITQPKFPLLIDEYNVPHPFLKELYYRIMDDNYKMNSNIDNEFEFWMLDNLDLIKFVKK